MEPVDRITAADHLNGYQTDALDRLFDRLIQLTTLSCIAYICIVWLVGGESSRLLAPALIATGGPLCNYVRRRTSQQLGFTVYVWSVWMAIMAQSTIRGGMLNPILHACIVLILMGGWLLGLRQASWLLVASVVWTTGISLADRSGWWHPAEMAVSWGYWLAMTPLCQTSCRLLFSRRMLRWSDKHEPKNTFPRIQRTSVAQVARARKSPSTTCCR